jgi:hypothetical protein
MNTVPLTIPFTPIKKFLKLTHKTTLLPLIESFGAMARTKNKSQSLPLRLTPKQNKDFVE